MMLHKTNSERSLEPEMKEWKVIINNKLTEMFLWSFYSSVSVFTVYSLLDQD